MLAIANGCEEDASVVIDAPPRTRFVVDTSVAVKWFRSGERFLDQAQALLDAHLEGRAHLLISHLLPFEVGNALLTVSDSELLPMDPLWLSDFEWVNLDQNAAQSTRTLAEAHGLSYYDASYLALAINRQAYLVTDDQDLLTAAELEGVGVPLEQIPIA